MPLALSTRISVAREGGKRGVKKKQRDVASAWRQRHGARKRNMAAAWHQRSSGGWPQQAAASACGEIKRRVAAARRRQLALSACGGGVAVTHIISAAQARRSKHQRGMAAYPLSSPA